MTKAAILAACLALSACGGSSGGGSGNAGPTLSPFEANVAAYVETKALGVSGITFQDQLPSGTVTYTGQSVWSRGAGIPFSQTLQNAIITSDARFTADFDARSVSLALDNFIDADSDPIEGEIEGTMVITTQVKDGRVDPPRFNGTLAGQLTNSSGEVMIVDPALVPPNRNYVSGSFDGDTADNISVIGVTSGFESTGYLKMIASGTRD